MAVTIIIPCFNEGENLPKFLADMCSLTEERADIHVVVCDDGSDPHHAQTIARAVERERKRKPNLRLQRSEHNRGKGATIAEALRSIDTEVVGFIDGDGSVPAAECLRLLSIFMGENVAAVIGSRIKMLGNEVQRKWRRHFLGRIFATLLSNLFNIPIYDSQCGCKFFSMSKLKPLIDQIDDQRWLWDTQAVILLYLRGESIREVPVIWRDTPTSNVSLFRDPPRMLWGLLKFRARVGR